MAGFKFSLPARIRNIARQMSDRYSSLCTTFNSRSYARKIVQYLNKHNFWNRLLTLPHFCIAFWIVLLLWGEVWVFRSNVKQCDWSRWEIWPKNASPHHLILLADPQLIDPHSYPSRPWPLDRLTITHTDVYLKRSYTSLLKILRPDTIIFLGDLFDGGREWKTYRSNLKDVSWSDNQRPSSERPYVKEWATRYNEDFWLDEYDRFGRIFYKFWNLGGLHPGPWQRGKKIISSLPGNHDLGFGDHIKISIRDRFQAYFGEGNRVDVIGNHTFVSVDSVSLSASGSSSDVTEIIKPIDDFLANVQTMKRRVVARELGFMAGKESLIRYPHKIEELASANFSDLPALDPGSGSPEFPTILLTHVPLYREPGTPCGPQREHWPPTVSVKGKSNPILSDERNAISISRGYQYQNVLSPDDSIRLLSSIGNVSSVFSGDDHDYCEVVHTADKNNVREITVKSISWAMGIRRPGFLLLSMWNPVDGSGRPLNEFPSGSDTRIYQTPLTTKSHLCLLPDEIGILITYLCFIILTLATLILHSILLSNLNLRPISSRDLSFEIPTTGRNLKQDVNTLSLSSSSSSLNSNIRTTIASRNLRNPNISNGNSHSVTSDRRMWNFSYSPTNIIEKNVGDITSNRNDPDEYWENFEPVKGDEKAFSALKRVRSKNPRFVFIRVAWRSIWRVTWVVVLIYLSLFWFY
ncbi:Cell division control protein 1 [Golovinomyces cichoracearum]|uniref:Cell division control protein 1 n=1 Tax=Golovinomyces cichoracearum TaxID=62708 RepID=A0A420H814_9PEZI|nr:Cell division control protein 1 [Golovinomyces cichoracearum]